MIKENDKSIDKDTKDSYIYDINEQWNIFSPLQEEPNFCRNPAAFGQDVPFSLSHPSDLAALVTDTMRTDQDIEPDEDLYDMGLDSLHLMMIVSALNDAGYSVGIAEFSMQPTLSDWWALLSRQTPSPTDQVASASLQDC
ncbi:phosphopantetheine-binding protein [Azospirillum himalayense]|uniref:Phosphopantetheine-binding protein n=1 Tax=Azospirillum himalayense TaxID=654847 RepID=A0ABW0GDU7_9PROT